VRFLLCEFKSSGSAEVIHECRGDILATRKSAPGSTFRTCVAKLTTSAHGGQSGPRG
jgi:hypothetical protein